MRVLVTGAGGFVGSHVARTLLAHRHQVIGMIRPASNRERLSSVGTGLELQEADLNQESAVANALEAHKPDIVIHAAWYAQPADYLHSHANLDSLSATARLARLSLVAGIRFVGVGTCLEYANTDQRRREEDPTEPSSLYAACKLAAWLLIRSLARQTGTQAAWLRLFHVYGPDEHPARLLPSFVSAVQAGRLFDASPGLQSRDPIHVRDCAAGIVHVAEQGESGIFNVCNGTEISLREYLMTAAEILRARDHVRFGLKQPRPDEPGFLVGDPTRLLNTGWRPRFPELRSGLEDALGDRARAAPGPEPSNLGGVSRDV